MVKKTKGGRYKVLKAIFSEAARLGIPQESLREDIPQSLIGRRLSQATAGELIRVLEHVKGNSKSEARNPKWQRYESSRDGLLKEVVDLARARFGEDFIVPLNNLCARFGESDGYRKMRIAALKELKRRLKELQRDDPWKPELKIVE